MTNPFQNTEKAKSIAEHISIIRQYQQIGIFNRDKAREICKRFNAENPEYNSTISVAAKITNSLTSIDFLADKELINNLKYQVIWIMGEDYLKSYGIEI
jgi:hypothetical protein